MDESDITAHFPPHASRMHAKFVSAPHPSLLDAPALLKQCEQRFQKRSGPGGQHRNKTSSGVFLTLQSTEIVAEATERRSQHDNRKMAIDRLRLTAAVELRTTSIFDQETTVEEELNLRETHKNTPLKFRQSHPDRPAILALVLNDLHATGGQPSLVAAHWQVSTSALTRLLKSHPEAFFWVNRCRDHHGRRPLH